MIYPQRVRPSQYGIFIECKPVDVDHPLVAHYCDKGILRFVRGRLCWGNDGSPDGRLCGL